MYLIYKKIIKIINLKTNSLINYFYYTANPKFINPINYLRKKREKLSIRKLKEINNGELFELINELLLKSNSTGCEFSDFYALWQSINKFKPNCILECGSGISSIIFAYYSHIFNGKEIKVYTVEENEYYYKDLLKNFPEQFKKYVDFLLLERKEKIYKGILGSYYSNLPNKNYDFIYIDGPTDRAVWNDKSYPKTFNSDLINILSVNKNIVINGVLDQRITTYKAFKNLINKNRLCYNSVHKLTYITSLSHKDLID